MDILTVNISRVSRPKFAIEEVCFVLESTDQLGSLPPRIKNCTPKREYDGAKKRPSLSGLAFTDKWQLPPEDFKGVFYAGESFSIHCFVSNSSFNTLKNVVMKAEIMPPNANQNKTKIKLYDRTNNPLQEFNPGDHYDFGIEHPLSAEGTYMLVVSCSFIADTQIQLEQLHPTDNATLQCLDATKQQYVYEKKYDFNVKNPLFMKSVKMFNLHDHILLRLDLMNITDSDLCLEKLTFDSTPNHKLLDHSAFNKTSRNFEKSMLPKEIRRYLFEFVPKSTAVAAQNKTQIPLGRISLQWKSNMGEIGSLITNTISCNFTPKPELSLKVLEIKSNGCIINGSNKQPQNDNENENESEQQSKAQAVVPASASNQHFACKVEEEIEVVVKLFNRTDDNADISIRFTKPSPFLAVSGNNVLSIGTVRPMESLQTALYLFSVQTGVANLPDMEIYDAKKNKTYPCNDLPKVLIIV